ncbi:uncharacterized protein SCHCODRAFT_084993 [Schizophyllum commune H4-8]|uniref:Expressed protein n=1 Tax=Schizophyllum commune (strain H4-8 / FGSC 9210) TaxID=578458 RepID=D8Q0V2_SCHCM|nr:uncharacterized protein SCHCODRAFT_084993 [Schizophyllum commune H4-8]KAI5895155.1 hypothetical protein SCHCODRAFT_084993 [Schizophyllum commune H4-8]
MDSPPANEPLTATGHPSTNGHQPVNGHASPPPPPPPPMNEYARTPSPRIQIDYQNLLQSCRVVLDGARALQSDFTADVHFKPPIEALETMFAAAHANVRMMRGERGVQWEVEVNRVGAGVNGREGAANGRDGGVNGRDGREGAAVGREGGAPRNGREPTTPVKVSSSPEVAKTALPEASRGLPPPPAVGQSQLIHAVEGEGQTCLGCDATTTPEWRRGPMGPRTLCNACGLVYAKMVKRRQKAEGREKQDMSESDEEDGMDVD